MINYTDKVRVEKVLVAATGTTLQVVAETLFNEAAGPNVIGPTTYAPGALQLLPGQIGMYDAVTRTSIAAGATVATNPTIFIAQGRNTANDSGALPARPVERSLDIIPSLGVRFVGEFCATPTNHAIHLENINVTDEALYEMRIAFNGRRSDIYNGRNTPAIYTQFEAPDYTALTPAVYADVAATRDHLVQNIVADIQAQGSGNTHSPSVLAIALDTTPAMGAATQVVNDIVAGAVITIGWTKGENPMAITFNVTEALEQTFLDAIAAGDLAGTEGIIPVVVTADAAAASGLTQAGLGVTAADEIILIAPDVRLAVYDKISQVKERINVGLVSGFNSAVTSTVISDPFEGKGLARQWQLFYESTDGLRKFDSSLPGLDGQAIGYPTDIVPGTTYASYHIYHSSTGMASNGLTSESPYLTILLVPCCDNALKVSVQDVLNPYFTSGGRTTFVSPDGSRTAVTIPACP